jgi:hypothetical protein
VPNERNGQGCPKATGFESPAQAFSEQPCPRFFRQDAGKPERNLEDARLLNRQSKFTKRFPARVFSEAPHVAIDKRNYDEIFGYRTGSKYLKASLFRTNWAEMVTCYFPRS